MITYPWSINMTSVEQKRHSMVQDIYFFLKRKWNIHSSSNNILVESKCLRQQICMKIIFQEEKITNISLRYISHENVLLTIIYILYASSSYQSKRISLSPRNWLKQLKSKTSGSFFFFPPLRFTNMPPMKKKGYVPSTYFLYRRRKKQGEIGYSTKTTCTSEVRVNKNLSKNISTSLKQRIPVKYNS